MLAADRMDFDACPRDFQDLQCVIPYFLRICGIFLDYWRLLRERRWMQSNDEHMS